MKIKCINAKGTKLIENVLYDVDYISDKYVKLSNLGYYTVKRFMSTDGKDLPKLYNAENEKITPKENMFVRCNISTKGNFLIKNKIYKISKIVANYSYLTIIKLEGSDVAYSMYNFKLLTDKETRVLKLKTINKKNINQEYNRKFDALTQTQKVSTLLKLMYTSLTYLEKIDYDTDIIDYVIKNNMYGIVKSDFDLLKEKLNL